MKQLPDQEHLRIMWQSTTRGAFCYNAESTRLNLKELANV